MMTSQRMVHGRGWLGSRLTLGIVVVLLHAGLAGCSSEAESVPSPVAAPVGLPPPTQHHHRLAHSSSPYLLQHADNPMDWYEWGDEAFAASKAQDKPIFLSVGYSTCHWCHVMSRESFSDPAIATFMNAHFICIKVDREQRPDVDRVYMEFVQATTGSGGWPMSVWLTPELKPFFGGTYFPPVDQGGRPGFSSILKRIDEVWHTHRAELNTQAETVLTALRGQREASPTDSTVTSASAVASRLIASFSNSFDEHRGGFGDAPKFPRPVALDALLAAHRHQPETPDGREALRIVLATLQAMERGGIHDHLGGGFHRYSVDGAWRVPHFEKMLYDQGQLAATFSEAYRLTGDPALAKTLRDVCDYVVRDLADPAGGFHAAEDADSLLTADGQAHAEGAWYVWSDAQIAVLLNADEAAVIRRRFGITQAGNIPAEQDPHGEMRQRNVLAMVEDSAATARSLNLEIGRVDALVASASAKMLADRAQRPRPHRDDKIVTAWNGLMITGLARAAAVLDEPRYAAAAVTAATFLRQYLYETATGVLYRSWRRGQRDGTPGMAADYAYLAQGLIDLAETTGDTQWLSWARDLLGRLDRDFTDPQGGWYDTDGHDPSVLLRLREDYDGAEPAASSVAFGAKTRLVEIFQDEAWRQRLSVIGSHLRRRAMAAPTAMPAALAATMLADQPLRRIVITGTVTSTRDLMRIAHQSAPERVLIRLDAGARSLLAGDQPFLAAMPAPEAPATAFVCTGTSCLPPTTDPQRLAEVLSVVQRP